MADAISDTPNFSYYGYVPSKHLNLAASIVFGVILAGQLFYTLKYRRFLFSLFFMAGIGLQLGGYIMRYQASSDDLNTNDFQIQFVFLTTGPAYMTTALYQVSPQIAALYGKQAIGHPIFFHLLFMIFSISAIVLQSVGASFVKVYMAEHYNGSEIGTKLVIAGLSVQIGFMLLFALIALNIYSSVKSYCLNTGSNYSSIHNHSKLKIVVFAFVVCFICILLRTVVRLIGMIQGMTGTIITHEGYLMGLEALPILIGGLGLTLFHPGQVMGKNGSLFDAKESSDLESEEYPLTA